MNVSRISVRLLFELWRIEFIGWRRRTGSRDGVALSAAHHLIAVFWLALIAGDLVGASVRELLEGEAWRIRVALYGLGVPMTAILVAQLARSLVCSIFANRNNGPLLMAGVPVRVVLLGRILQSSLPFVSILSLEFVVVWRLGPMNQMEPDSAAWTVLIGLALLGLIVAALLFLLLLLWSPALVSSGLQRALADVLMLAQMTLALLLPIACIVCFRRPQVLHDWALRRTHLLGLEDRLLHSILWTWTSRLQQTIAEGGVLHSLLILGGWTATSAAMVAIAMRLGEAWLSPVDLLEPGHTVKHGTRRAAFLQRFGTPERIALKTAFLQKDLLWLLRTPSVLAHVLGTSAVLIAIPVAVTMLRSDPATSATSPTIAVTGLASWISAALTARLLVQLEGRAFHFLLLPQSAPRLLASKRSLATLLTVAVVAPGSLCILAWADCRAPLLWLVPITATIAAWAGAAAGLDQGRIDHARRFGVATCAGDPAVPPSSSQPLQTLLVVGLLLHLGIQAVALVAWKSTENDAGMLETATTFNLWIVSLVFGPGELLFHRTRRRMCQVGSLRRARAWKLEQRRRLF